jgi:hypothetical protein
MGLARIDVLHNLECARRLFSATVFSDHVSARMIAVNSPTGPAPTTNTSVSCVFIMASSGCQHRPETNPRLIISCPNLPQSCRPHQHTAFREIYRRLMVSLLHGDRYADQCRRIQRVLRFNLSFPASVVARMSPPSVFIRSYPW